MTDGMVILTDQKKKRNDPIEYLWTDKDVDTTDLAKTKLNVVITRLKKVWYGLIRFILVPKTEIFSNLKIMNSFIKKYKSQA